MTLPRAVARAAGACGRALARAGEADPRGVMRVLNATAMKVLPIVKEKLEGAKELHTLIDVNNRRGQEAQKAALRRNFSRDCRHSCVGGTKNTAYHAKELAAFKNSVLERKSDIHIPTDSFPVIYRVGIEGKQIQG